MVMIISALIVAFSIGSIGRGLLKLAEVLEEQERTLAHWNEEEGEE